MFWLFGFFLHKMHTSEMSLGARFLCLLFFPYSLALAALRPAKTPEAQMMERYLASHPVEAYRQLLRTPKHFFQILLDVVTGTKPAEGSEMLGYGSYMQRIYQSLSDEEKKAWEYMHPEMNPQRETERSESVSGETEGESQETVEGQSIDNGNSQGLDGASGATVPEETSPEAEAEVLVSPDREMDEIFSGFEKAGGLVVLKGFFTPEGELVVGVPPERMNTISAAVSSNGELSGVAVKLVPIQDLDLYRTKSEELQGDKLGFTKGIDREFSLFYNPGVRTVLTSGQTFGHSQGWDDFVEQADRVDSLIESMKEMVVRGVDRQETLDFQKGVYFRETPGKYNSYDICLGDKKGPQVIATVSYNARNKWEAVISSKLVDEKKPEKERIIYGAIPFQTELFEKIKQTTGEDVTDCKDITSGVELLRRFEPVVKSEKNIKALTDCITSDNRKYMVDKLSVQQNVKSQGVKIG